MKGCSCSPQEVIADLTNQIQELRASVCEKADTIDTLREELEDLVVSSFAERGSWSTLQALAEPGSWCSGTGLPQCPCTRALCLPGFPEHPAVLELLIRTMKEAGWVLPVRLQLAWCTSVVSGKW